MSSYDCDENDLSDDGWYVSAYSRIKDEKLLVKPIHGGKTALHRWPRTGSYEKAVRMFKNWDIPKGEMT